MNLQNITELGASEVDEEDNELEGEGDDKKTEGKKSEGSPASKRAEKDNKDGNTSRSSSKGKYFNRDILIPKGSRTS